MSSDDLEGTRTLDPDGNDLGSVLTLHQDPRYSPPEPEEMPLRMLIDFAFRKAMNLWIEPVRTVGEYAFPLQGEHEEKRGGASSKNLPTQPLSSSFRIASSTAP